MLYIHFLLQAHMHPDSYGAVYGPSKMARELPAEKVQIVNFHPEAVLTVTVRQVGYDENTLL